MIQDIAPHHFDNQYHPRPPKTDDGVLLYRKGRVYIQEDGHIPAVRELCGEDRDRLQYLFSIDERITRCCRRRSNCRRDMRFWP